ncbi:hypothetical protein LCGC14_2429890, partial [marine sediment metagenome]
ASEQVYLDAGITSDLRRWWTVTLGSGITCPDCPSRDGQIRTLLEWQNIGKPRSGWSVCGPHDYCQLIPVEVPHDGLVNVSEILKTVGD